METCCFRVLVSWQLRPTFWRREPVSYKLRSLHQHWCSTVHSLLQGSNRALHRIVWQSLLEPLPQALHRWHSLTHTCPPCSSLLLIQYSFNFDIISLRIHCADWETGEKWDTSAIHMLTTIWRQKCFPQSISKNQHTHGIRLSHIITFKSI